MQQVQEEIRRMVWQDLEVDWFCARLSNNPHTQVCLQQACDWTNISRQWLSINIIKSDILQNTIENVMRMHIIEQIQF